MRKLLSILLAVLMLAGLSTFAIVANAAAPIEITSADDLVALMNKSGNFADWSASYVLTADIDLTGKTQATIGNASGAFSGTFDGQGHTIKGVNITSVGNTADTNTGLFGRVSNSTIKNLTVYGVFSTTGKRAGVVGCAINDVTIENVTNYAKVTALANAGGILGYTLPGAGKTVSVKNCVNHGAVKTTETSPHTANTGTGGIVGSTGNTGTVEISGCANYGGVTGLKQIGGICGYFYGAEKLVDLDSALRKLYNCYNKGTISATAGDQADAGGIVGILFYASGLHSCWNEGKVSGAAGVSGGIVGRAYSDASDSTTKRGAKWCYSYSSVMPTSENGGKVGAIIGSYAGGFVSNVSNFFAAGLTDTTSGAEELSAESFGALNGKKLWILTADGTPELFSFHTHVWGDPEPIVGTDKHADACTVSGCNVIGDLEDHFDNAGDNLCDACGAALACDHDGTEKRWEIVKVATCATTGLEKEICEYCEQETGATREVAVDLQNHTARNYTWHKNVETGKYYCLCTACNTPFLEQTEQPTVYVDAHTKADAGLGNDQNAGTSAQSELRTLEEAFRRLAETGGTVVITDRYYVEKDINLPANAEKITVTSGINGGTGKTGFYFKTTPRIRLAGDVEFKYLYFYADTAAARTVVFVCNWNDLTFGTGIATSVTGFVIAGAENAGADDMAENSQQIVLTAVNEVAFTGDSNLSAAPRFYSKVFLGTRYNTNPTTDRTIGNKTVALTVCADGTRQAQLPELYAGSTASCTTPVVGMENCNVTINLQDGSKVTNLLNGSGNTNDTAATAYLDNLTINLCDNAVLEKAAILNVKHITLNIEDSAKANSLMFSKTASYAVDGSETLTATFGSHGVPVKAATGLVKGTHYNAMYAPTQNVTDQCTWDEGQVTTAATCAKNGVMTYTCSVCGATKKIAIPATGEHTYGEGVFTMVDKNTANMVYTCTVCGEETVEDLVVNDAAEGKTMTAKMIELGNGEIAFIAAVDSLDYTAAGFIITIDGVEKTFAVDTAYEKITAGSVEFDSTDFGMENGYVYGLRVAGVSSYETISFTKVLTGGAN